MYVYESKFQDDKHPISNSSQNFFSSVHEGL